MAYAVNLLFNRSLAEVIAGCWTRLADADVSRSMLNLAYPPHVTLAVYDTLRTNAAVAALDRVFENVAQMAVTLTDLKSFGAGSGVLYAAMAPSIDLMRLHAMTAAVIDEACRPHYRTGGWIPHCTLATGLSDTNLDRAKTVLERDWRSLTGIFERAALVEFIPVTGIKSWPLAATPHSSRTP
jgi:2'-5' RNA ligase